MGASTGAYQALTTLESHSIQAELERERDRLKLLLDMTNTLVSNLELHDLLRAISATIRRDMHCDSVGVWLPDPECRQLCQCVMDFPESKGFLSENLLRPIEGSELGSVFKTGRPFVARTQVDVTSEWSSTMVRAEAVESGCVLPLISRNERSAF
jgi:formate hydrogenlyase transcriptional activator